MPFHKYASDAEIIADYLPEVSVSDADQVAIVGRRNEAVSAMIDSYCKRRPGYFLPASDTATPKQIRGENKNFLILPIHVFGTVSVSGISSSAFYESGKNGWLYAQNPNAAGLDDYFDSCASFWSAARVYVVSARWGFEQTPAEIIEACKIIASHLFENGAGILGDVTTAGFILARDMPPTARTLLQPYIKREFERE